MSGENLRENRYLREHPEVEPRGFEPLTSAVQRRCNSLQELSGGYETPANVGFLAQRRCSTFLEIYSGCCTVAAQVGESHRVAFGLLADAPVRLPHPTLDFAWLRAPFVAHVPPHLVRAGPTPPRTWTPNTPRQGGDRLPVRGTPMGRSVDRSGVVSLRHNSVRGDEGHRPLLGRRYRRRRGACRREQRVTPWGSKKNSRS